KLNSNAANASTAELLSSASLTISISGTSGVIRWAPIDSEPSEEGPIYRRNENESRYLGLPREGAFHAEPIAQIFQAAIRAACRCLRRREVLDRRPRKSHGLQRTATKNLTFRDLSIRFA